MELGVGQSKLVKVRSQLKLKINAKVSVIHKYYMKLGFAFTN